MPPMERYGLAFAVPLFATLLLTPFAGRLAHRFGVLDHPGGHKTHHEATPYLGGLAVGAGLVLVATFATGANGELITVLIGALVLAGVGLIDDIQGVPPLLRLGYEGVAGLALWLVGIRAGVLNTPWVDLPVTVLWVVAVTNAFNFIDNMDGLAAAAAAMSALGIGAIAAYNGDYLVGSFAFAVAGAVLGVPAVQLPARQDLPGRRGLDAAGLPGGGADPEARPAGGGGGAAGALDRAAGGGAPVRSDPRGRGPPAGTAAASIRAGRITSRTGWRPRACRGAPSSSWWRRRRPRARDWPSSCTGRLSRWCWASARRVIAIWLALLVTLLRMPAPTDAGALRANSSP